MRNVLSEMKNVSEKKNKLVPIAIVNQHVGIVKALLAFMAENPTLRSLSDEFKFLLTSYVYEDLKKYLEDTVMFAYIVRNNEFIEALISVMKEKGMEAELDLMMKSLHLELFI